MFLKLILLCLLVVGASAVRNWDYSFISIDYDVKADYIQCDVGVERVKRGDYAIKGSFSLDKELGPNYKGKTFRSPRGNDDYKPMPFSMEKQDFDTFFNGVYKKVIMEDLHKCSNLPYYEDKWEGTVKAMKYELDMCKVSVDNWPDNMLPGFYKLVLDFWDDEDNSIATSTIVVQIETTGMGK